MRVLSWRAHPTLDYQELARSAAALLRAEEKAKCRVCSGHRKMRCLASNAVLGQQTSSPLTLKSEHWLVVLPGLFKEQLSKVCSGTFSLSHKAAISKATRKAEPSAHPQGRVLSIFRGSCNRTGERPKISLSRGDRG